MISIKVPARICFFGDHQDYLGLPVIAGTINRYIELKAKATEAAEFRINLPDIQSHRTISLNSEADIIPEDYLRSAMAVLKKKGFSFKQGYEVDISGDIPVNAGLSSSSALTVAWIRFLIAIQEKKNHVSDAEVGSWAYEAEVVFFDSPGGLMDQYTIAQQGLLFINTKEGKTERLVGDLGKLIVAESGIKKKTLNVLKNARTYQEKAIRQVQLQHPNFNIHKVTLADFKRYKACISREYHDHWYAAVRNYQITREAKKLLSFETLDLEKIGQLMDEHQSILENQIKNTPLEMITMMKAARNAGAFGAKTIGSGGGGCMVAIVSKDTKEEVINAFLAKGAINAYEVHVKHPKT